MRALHQGTVLFFACLSPQWGFQRAGDLAVHQGKDFHDDNKFEEEAEKWAMVKSMRWHRDQIDKIVLQAEKSGHFGTDCIDDYLA